MKTVLALITALTLATPALAQQYKWIDKDGKLRYGDTPPPGVRAQRMQTPGGSAPAPSAAQPGAKDAKKGPLTPAEQDMEYRKRQAEAAKAGEKAEQERKDAQAKAENCERSREQLRSLAIGRVSRIDAKGERYYLDDNQLAEETSRAREQEKQWCN